MEPKLIVEKNAIKNIPLAELIIKKLLLSFTQNISINKWYNEFKSMGLKISKDSPLFLYKLF